MTNDNAAAQQTIPSNYQAISDKLQRIESASHFIFDHLITHASEVTAADRRSYTPNGGDAAALTEVIILDVRALKKIIDDLEGDL